MEGYVLISKKEYTHVEEEKQVYVKKFEYDFEYDEVDVRYTPCINMAHIFDDNSLFKFFSDLIRTDNDEREFLEKIKVDRKTIPIDN
ncbi:MAG: hypothetical protein ACRCZ2_00035 [Fusobacteriaceae bacterium]